MQFRQTTVEKASMSSLCGYVTAPYSKLVEVFGNPTSNGDQYKTDVEWILAFNDGTVATIYNWKNGPNYCGDHGMPVEKMTEWHVGGFSDRALRLVESALASN